MSLTLHLDASDNGRIFTTYQSSGVHTGVPSDGSAVEVWDDDAGISDVCLVYPTTTTEAPAWRSLTPLMLQPCIDFDGANDTLTTWTQNASAPKPLSAFIAAGAYTLMMACYGEAITSIGTGPTGHALIADNDAVWGVFLRNASGQRKAILMNWTGAAYQSVEVNITEVTPFVLMARHDAGNIYLSVNGGTEVSIASGNTTGLTAQVGLGKIAGSSFYNGRIGELKIWNTGNADGALASEIASFMTKWITPAAPALLFTKMLLGVGR